MSESSCCNHEISKCLLALACLQNCTWRENVFNEIKECAKNKIFGFTVTNAITKKVLCIRLGFIFITTCRHKHLGMFELKNHGDASQIRIRVYHFSIQIQRNSEIVSGIKKDNACGNKNTF